MAQYGLVRRKVAGCVFGLASIAGATRGRPLCKKWGIWTSSKSLALSLDREQVLCQGGHPSTPVSGVDTAHSGAYTDSMARYVIVSLCTPAGDVSRAIEHGTWSIQIPPFASTAGGALEDGLEAERSRTGTEAADAVLNGF